MMSSIGERETWGLDLRAEGPENRGPVPPGLGFFSPSWWATGAGAHPHDTRAGPVRPRDYWHGPRPVAASQEAPAMPRSPAPVLVVLAALGFGAFAAPPAHQPKVQPGP